VTTIRTILTVDDSRTMLEMLRAALSDLGYRVIQAADGLDGLERLEEESPDVIITDFNMPGLDGPGFIERVRQDPRHRGTPILVLTTETGSAEKDRARRAGATGWIVKPFEPAKLSDAIRRVMP
jgi:two-component system chemotaxis response regulator CheY